MKLARHNKAPADADARQSIKPVICYPVDTLPTADMKRYAAACETLELVDTVIAALSTPVTPLPVTP